MLRIAAFGMLVSPMLRTTMCAKINKSIKKTLPQKRQLQQTVHNYINKIMMELCIGGLGYCGRHREKEKERWQSDAENINVWNGHYYFIQMPFLCLKNLSCNGSTNAAHVKRKPRDRRWFKWERRAYAKTTCVTAISKQWICGKLGRTLAFFRAQPVC